MKIAFVGKGGAGKTTFSALFSQFASQKNKVLAIDADINVHLVKELGGEILPEDFLSEKTNSEKIREYLRGENFKIRELSHFRKSTPPANGSKLIDITDKNDEFISNFTHKISKSLNLAAVGTYSEDGISSSCYHNNLAISENILSHTINNSGILCVDMVAGTDAFASTLFAQFDALILVVEPTRRGIEVFEQYKKLAKSAGIENCLKVVGNKVEDEFDSQFLRENLGDFWLGNINNSKYLRRVDKGFEKLSFEKLEPENLLIFENIFNFLKTNFEKITDKERLEKLWRAHEVYSSQDFVKRAVGDISDQIDKDFCYEK